jgi:hypothetical protein
MRPRIRATSPTCSVAERGSAWTISLAAGGWAAG